MNNHNVRKAAVAGTFYAADGKALVEQLETAFAHSLGPGTSPKVNSQGRRRIIGVVCPHAGYPYSAPVAAHAYAALAEDGRPDVAILIGPNHRGQGAQIAIDNSESWQTPLGATLVDAKMAVDIQAHSRHGVLDSLPHSQEHSLEVQLPFLQYLYGSKIRIVPISMAAQDLETSADLGRAIAAAAANANIVIIASTDLTHYETQQKVVEADQIVLEAIIRIAPADLLKTVSKERISMCGAGPVAAMMVAAQMLGAVRARILSYATSGDISGDHSRIVGYAAAEIALAETERHH